jgi:hypothetical protein
MNSKLHLVGLIATMLATGLATPARADRNHGDAADSDAADVDDDGRHYLAAAGWAALELAIPAWYYWHTQDEQEVDWTMPSWKDKLTLRAVRFDTNPFHVNAIRHPLAGLGDYQIARSNGFSALESTIFAYVAGAIWEFFIEYHEDPSLNDLVMNGAGGLALGEPLYQIGQLWRGGELSAIDRVRTAAFSPFAGAQDLWRPHRMWHRRRAWSDFAFTAGPISHRLDGGGDRDELAVGLDIDVVRHPGFAVPGARDGRIAAGAWSRVALGVRFGDTGNGSEPVATMVRTRTALAGTYRQDDDGDGRLLALGTAFTYRRDRIAAETDHVAIAHLLGPQLQLSRRTPGGELRFDLAAYVDFGLIDAHVFGPVSPLPPAPPYLSTLQVAGYYNAAGASLEARVRGDRGPLHAEIELGGHRLWSLDFADRVQQTADASRSFTPSSINSPQRCALLRGPAKPDLAISSPEPIPATPHGVSDLRLYGRAQVGVRSGPWGIAAVADGAYRRGAWSDLSRATGDWSLGVLGTANF